MRVVIAEDQVLLREGLVRLFEDAGHAVVRTQGDAEGMVEIVSQVRPDLVVLDIRMPPDFSDEGARAAVALKDADPTTAVLMLSQHIETRHVARLVRMAGFGYLLKDRVLDVAEFLAAAEQCATGSRRWIRRLSGAWYRPVTRVAHWLHSATARGRCCTSWRRGSLTRVSPTAWSSASARLRHTCGI